MLVKYAFFYSGSSALGVFLTFFQLFCAMLLLFRKIVVSLHPLKEFFNYLNIKSMYLDSEKKKEIFGTYGTSNTDTGSAESQIALFSYRIAHLTEHLKANRKDYSTQRALTMLVGKRRSLLNYLKDRDINRYRAIVAKLGLRR